MVTLERREGQLQQELYHVHRGIQKIEKEEKKISIAVKKRQPPVAESDTESGVSDVEDSSWSEFE